MTGVPVLVKRLTDEMFAPVLDINPLSVKIPVDPKLNALLVLIGIRVGVEASEVQF